jgi:peptidyl-prolyl cis-trans isomerase C
VIRKIGRNVALMLVFAFVFAAAAGCDTNADKNKTAKQIMAPPQAENVAVPLPAGQNPALSNQEDDGEIAVEVDGKKMTRGELNRLLEQKIAQVRSRIQPEQMEQARAQIRKELIDEFVNLTLLKKEIAAKKVTASEKEISDFIDKMKANIPPGKTFDEFLMQNKIDMAKLREDIGNNIKIEKLISKEAGGDLKVTDKEASDFYDKNPKMFAQPESVHARHILVAGDSKDTEKVKAEKRAKAEDIRKQLLAGADFAELAVKNSDCPSKQKGGDLGTFARGQMVKPFEDAAFSQAPKAIGPVVETDFGYHIIQVLEHHVSRTVKLDAELKKRLMGFLERKKQEEALGKLIKRLKATADIVISG